MTVTEPVTDPATSGPFGAPYLAVDVQPDILAGAFTLGVSELGGTDVLGGISQEARWVNVVCDVTGVSLRRGATALAGVLTRAEAGSVVVTANDVAGELDPLRNNENIHRGTAFRLRAWGYTLDPDTSDLIEWTSVLFTGRVSEVRAAYLPGQPATVTIDASDLIAALAGWEAEGHAGDGIGAGDTLITRVERVLDEADIGEISPDSETAFYNATLLPTVLGHAWDVIVAAADAELGAVWVNEDNQLVVHSRAYMFTSLFAGPIRGTLSDVHGDADTGPHVCMSEAVVVYDADVANRVLASRRALEGEDSSALVVTRMDDVYSQTRYGLNTLDRTSQLEVQNAPQVARWVSDVMASGGVPWLRVDTVNPSPTEGMLEEALTQWQAVMSTQIGDRWQFRFHPADLVVDQVLDIQGIEMDLGPDAWSITWTTMRGGNRRQVRPRPAT